MKCAKVRNLLIDYVDGVLRPAPADRVREHLVVCEACRIEEGAARVAADALAALPRLSPPEDVLERLETRLAFLPPVEIPARAGRIRAFLLPYAAGLATAALVLLVVLPLAKGPAAPVEPTPGSRDFAPASADLAESSRDVPLHYVEDRGLLRTVTPEMMKLLRDGKMLRGPDDRGVEARPVGYEKGGF